MSEIVTIEKSKLKRLVKRDMLLEEMEAWGVDNWNGWEYVERPTDKEVLEEVERISDEAAS